jgi:tellurite resistance protein
MFWQNLYHLHVISQNNIGVNRSKVIFTQWSCTMSDTVMDGHVEIESKPKHTIRLLPINLFTSVMGIAGLSLAWREAAKLNIVSDVPGEAIGWVAVVVFIALAVGYGVKYALHPQAIAAEYAHPVMNSFFATVAIGMLLLSSFLRPYGSVVGQAVWVAGTMLTFLIAYDVMQRFISKQHQGEHTLPALLIPGVATLDIVVTGTTMPFSWAHEVNMLAFAVGSIIAGVLIVLIFSRLRHHEVMPVSMRPSLLVLVAPFAVGFLAYTNLTGRVDIFASSLFYFAFFLLLLLAPKLFRSGIPFSVSWWAISFPLAAFSIASFRYSTAVDSDPLRLFATALFVVLVVAIAVLFVRTLVIVVSGRLFRLENGT